MKILFLYNNIDNGYQEQLNLFASKFGMYPEKYNLELIEKYKEFDVVAASGLNKAEIYMFRGLEIPLVVFGSIKEYYELSDIVVDYAAETGSAHNLIKGDLDMRTDNGSFFRISEMVHMIKILEWDSDFFGFPTALVTSKYLTGNIEKYIVKFSKTKNIRLVEYLANCHDRRSIITAENNGYSFVDIRLTYETTVRKTDIDNNTLRFSKAEEADIEELKVIGDDLYMDSRYYFDSNFDVQKTRIFYLNWIEKAVRGQFDKECLIVRDNEKILGFCTIRDLKNTGEAAIGLFGVNKATQGMGIGKIVMNNVFNYLYERDYRKLIVVTQGRNYAAQKLYQRSGFVTSMTEVWYHKWL